MDEQTWGWIKVLGGLIALWLAWRAGIAMNINGAIAILAAITLIGGALKSTGKKRR